MAFLDADQELLAPRYRAAEQALGLFARAARLVGDKAGGGRVLVQTFVPRHEAVQAALHADPARAAEAERARRELLPLPPGDGDGRGVRASRLPPSSTGWGRPSASRCWARPTAAGCCGPPTTGRLCDALAVAERPAGRLRIAVDPTPGLTRARASSRAGQPCDGPASGGAALGHWAAGRRVVAPPAPGGPT